LIEVWGGTKSQYHINGTMNIDHLAELRATKVVFILRTPFVKRVRDWVDLRRKSLTPNSVTIYYTMDEYFWVFHTMGPYV
jgi:hypothetical protein